MIKLHSAVTFSKEIERLVEENKLGYLETIMDYCADRQIEIESIPKLITPTLKAKLREEGEKLNFLEKKGSKLDFLE